jgi:hypothetical protein
VAAHAFTASDSLNAQSSAAGDLGGSVATGVSINIGRTGLIRASLQQLYRGLDAKSAGNLVTGVETSKSCADGGSISAKATIAVEGQVSSGDNVSITANNCVEGGLKLNGGVSFAFSDVTGTIGSEAAWSATLAILYSNFTTEAKGEVLRVNGDLRLGYSQTSSVVASASATGNSLQISFTRNGTTVVDRTMSNFNYSGTINSDVFTYSANYTLSGKLGKLGNTSYTVKTNTPFKATGSAFPSEGSLTVTATDNTALTLTALDSINVRIDLDTNGDGKIDETINTTWSDLSSRG